MDFGNPFECPVCLDFYNYDDRIPTTLACGHSYCLSHLGMLDECCICRSSVRTGTGSAAPSFALRDGALIYLSLIKKLQALGVSTEDMADIPQPIVVTAESVSVAVSIVRPPPPAPRPAPRTEQQAVFQPHYNVPIAGPIASDIKSGCGHICCISSIRSCCHCSDLRPVRPAYQSYVDGVGFCATATRDAGYCPFCKNSPRASNRSVVAADNVPDVSVAVNAVAPARPEEEVTHRNPTRRLNYRFNSIRNRHSNEEYLRAYRERVAAEEAEAMRQREEVARRFVEARIAFQLKSCGHSCTYSSLERCCACMDRREYRAEGTYPLYIDGQGWVDRGLRNAGYCPVCK